MDNKRIITDYECLLPKNVQENLTEIDECTQREKNKIIRETERMEADYKSQIEKTEKRIAEKKRMLAILEELSEHSDDAGDIKGKKQETKAYRLFAEDM